MLASGASCVAGTQTSTGACLRCKLCCRDPDQYRCLPQVQVVLPGPRPVQVLASGASCVAGTQTSTGACLRCKLCCRDPDQYRCLPQVQVVLPGPRPVQVLASGASCVTPADIRTYDSGSSNEHTVTIPEMKMGISKTATGIPPLSTILLKRIQGPLSWSFTIQSN